MQIILQKNENKFSLVCLFLVIPAELLWRIWLRVAAVAALPIPTDCFWNLSKKCNLCQFIHNSRILTGKWCQSLHFVTNCDLLCLLLFPVLFSLGFLFYFLYIFFQLSKFDKIYHHVTIRELNWKIIHSAVLINAWCSNSNMSSITWAPVWWHHIT